MLSKLLLEFIEDRCTILAICFFVLFLFLGVLSPLLPLFGYAICYCCRIPFCTDKSAEEVWKTIFAQATPRPWVQITRKDSYSHSTFPLENIFITFLWLYSFERYTVDPVPRPGTLQTIKELSYILVFIIHHSVYSGSHSALILYQLFILLTVIYRAYKYRDTSPVREPQSALLAIEKQPW